MSTSRFRSVDFGSSVCSRGRVYFQSNKVGIVVFDATNITANVRGSGFSPYVVELSWDPDIVAIDAFCTCPHYAKEQLCKHIWAVLLKADTLGWPATGSRGIAVMHAGLYEPPDNDRYDEDEYADDSFDTHGVTQYLSVAAPPPTTPDVEIRGGQNQQRFALKNRHQNQCLWGTTTSLVRD